MQSDEKQNRILGVLGGVGPRASAEFLKTIYEQSRWEHEQNAPRVLMYSDPSFPDRTETFLRGDCDGILKQLNLALNSLRTQGASRIVICCVTFHHLLPRLPEDLRAPIISLIDVILERVRRDRNRHLLICTKGTRGLKIFQHHAHWEEAKCYVLWPDERDQESIHQLLYRIKRNEHIQKLIPALEALLAKYRVDSFVAGCTEMHVLAKKFNQANGARANYGCVDPLTIIAEELAKTGV